VGQSRRFSRAKVGLGCLSTMARGAAGGHTQRGGARQTASGDGAVLLLLKEGETEFGYWAMWSVQPDVWDEWPIGPLRKMIQREDGLAAMGNGGGGWRLTG
jgi:hypothetical protein